ncbi:MAG: hypothetical protein LBG92_07215 [Prevotellaceae bacterium]|jgi:hypothetical protein|nr:hypothetical protein [Prevotellaceae bacterium]
MIFESIYLAKSQNFHNRRSTTGGRNIETITLPVKAEPCGAENIQVLAVSQFFGIMFVRMSNDIRL